MSSNVIIIMILLLCYFWILCSTTRTYQINYFNRKIWFDNGNIFHIDQKDFWNNFQQHRNVNRHINWISNEILLVNNQIKSVKDRLAFGIHTIEEDLNLPEENNDNIEFISLSSKNELEESFSTITKLKNDQNIYLLKLLSNESLFNDYLEDLIDIYEHSSLTTTIECIGIINEQNSNEKYLFIKLTDGNIDKYHMNKTKSFKETRLKINQPILIWNNDGKQPEYYRRFIHDNKQNQIIMTDLLMEIKNRPKINDINFFDMMGQILRIKYHTDPSSLSCILEMFFGSIYTCDGRLIHPHELTFLSDNNSFFVFYAVMMDTITEKQIYPLDTNNHIRYGDQIYFLFNNHPQFNTLSSLTCADCPKPELAYPLINNEEEIEQKTDNRIIETKLPVDNTVQNFIFTNSQNFIVYTIVTSILIYILIGIYISRKQESTEYFGKRQSISSRRGR